MSALASGRLIRGVSEESFWGWRLLGFETGCWVELKR